MKEHQSTGAQNAYNALKCPAEMDMVVRRAVDRAHKAKKQSLLSKRTLLPVAAALLASVLTLNAMPEFGRAMEQLPGIGWVVRAVRLENYLLGGAITDGQEVGPITISRNTIEITFTQGQSATQTAPWFKTTKQDYPHGLLLELQGVRSLFAGGVMPEITSSPLIRNTYRIITLDDSAQRIMFTFNGPVEVTVTEVASPAGIRIKVAPGQTAATARRYAVRTSSHDVGEQIGIKEGVLNAALGWPESGVRMLQDNQGKHFVEAGLFATRELAEAFIAKIRSTGQVDFALQIEQRGPSDIPVFIAP
ncbi:MAG: hypothetical protein KGZ50_09750 [Peptococcaceae bacterium]|nr:hypothetical protein [Peptococcaceae bacterium]